jgi:uncharacterized protein YegP (UPF0339 family)
MAKFEITKRKNDEFQFNLKASNGEIILTSEGYKSKSGCTNGIDSVKKNSADDNHFKKLESTNGKPYFTLVAGNGEIIGTSEMYESISSRDHGIESVKKNAPVAEIVDQS